MNIKQLSPEKWLSRAEQSGITVHRCVYWQHKDSGFNKYRYMKNHLLIFVEQGKLLAELDEKTIPLAAGDVLWISPGTLRRTYVEITNTHEKDHRLHFNIGNGKNEFRLPQKTPVIRKAWELMPLFQMLSEACRDPQKYNRQFLHGICLALTSEFLSLYESKTERAFSNKQVNLLYSFIINNADRNIAPSELAAVVKLSPDYFSRKFRNDFGISPKKFIKQEKIRFIAGFLLESGLSVKEIAFHFGYEEPSYFCRQFREVMKCSPMTHRKKNI
jgi:AraC-like DNA-binding protein